MRLGEEAEVVHIGTLVAEWKRRMENRMRRLAMKKGKEGAAQPPDEGRLSALPEINEVVVVGRLLNAPKTRLVNGEHKMARFMLAVDRSYHNGAGKRVHSTAYVPVVAWRAVAQAAEALGKGDAVRTEGRLHTWQSTEGQKYRWEVEADLLEVLRQRQGAKAGQPEPAGV